MKGRKREKGKGRERKGEKKQPLEVTEGFEVIVVAIAR